MSKRPGLCALVALGACTLPAAPARAQGKEWETIIRSGTILSDVVKTHKKDMTPALLKNAYAVAIVPRIIKAGFIIGGRFGQGVVLVKTPAGWSNPVFISLGGGSFGFQAGVQSTDLVMVFKTKQSVDSFLQGEGKLSIAADGSLAFGSLGRYAEAGEGIALKSSYVAFSKNRGLFAGASLAGTGLAIDGDANASFYGRPVTSPNIITGAGLKVPETSATVANQLRTVLSRATRTPANIQPVVDDDSSDDAPRVSQRPSKTTARPQSDDDGPVIEDPPARKPAKPRKPTTTTSDDSPAFPFP